MKKVSVSKCQKIYLTSWIMNKKKIFIAVDTNNISKAKNHKWYSNE